MQLLSLIQLAKDVEEVGHAAQRLPGKRVGFAP